jgi:hypothetical protein
MDEICNWLVLLISNKLGRRPLHFSFSFSSQASAKQEVGDGEGGEPHFSLTPVARQSNLTCLTSNNKQSNRVLLRLILLMMRKKIFTTVPFPSPQFRLPGSIIGVYKVNTGSCKWSYVCTEQIFSCIILSTLQYIQKRQSTVENFKKSNPKKWKSKNIVCFSDL